jgi:ferric-dicitrate binding protein FerR (iron transport regulator)
MDKNTFFSLLDKYRDDTASPAEKKLVEEYYRRLEEMGITNLSAEEELALKERMYRAIVTEIKEPVVRKIFTLKRVVAAAAILVFIAAGYWWLSGEKKSSEQPPITRTPNSDVNPGSYKARLTLSDGRRIILDSAALGELAKQGSTVVINKDGQLIYNSQKDNQPVVYNTVSTNKGETYSFTLADGSRVWLNSGSSIYFPVAFPGKERRIEVTGEVYVQVAHNASQPFIASANGMEVLALGTEFNINSYSDEDNISATLIEGTVRVSKGNVNKILKQGQQTQLNNKGELTTPREVNTDEIIGWKDGFFHFESADLKTILRQFARWYDIEIIYEGTVTDRKFFGIVKRSNTLKRVLEMLQDNNIEYRIEGKKLIVKSS